MKERKTLKLKVRKTNRFIYQNHHQAPAALSDSTTVTTTTLTGFTN